MNATRRHEGGVGRATSDAAVRGALLIAVAVVIGMLLLWRAHDDPETASSGTTDGTTAPGVVTTAPGETVAPNGETTVPPVTTAPPPVTHVPNQVPVLVANGSGTKGGAGAVTAKLIPLGYDTKPAADADQIYEKSRIFYREGFAEDARAIARALGVVEPVDTIIEAMPATAPVRGATSTANAQSAQVLVLLGTDLVIKQT
jgi:LytR cell envelope-related transcriptional attenuator